LVKIRLRRTGKKKQPSYRIVVADSRMPRDGRYLEVLGFYDPMTEPSTIRIDPERALYWLQQGAQPTRQVQNLLKIEGIWDQFKLSRDTGGTNDERSTGVSGEGTG
jgi:small subunit ribosomal protein S16